MDDQILHGLQGILHLQGELFMEDHPSIPNLTACLPIEGRLLRNDFDFVPFHGKGNDLIALDQFQNPGVGLNLLIP